MACIFDSSPAAQYQNSLALVARHGQTTVEGVIKWNRPLTGSNPVSYKFTLTGGGESIDSEVFSFTMPQVGNAPTIPEPAREDYPPGIEPMSGINSFVTFANNTGGSTRTTITGLQPGTRYVISAWCVEPGGGQTPIPLEPSLFIGPGVGTWIPYIFTTYPEQTVVTNPISAVTSTTAALSGSTVVGAVEMDNYLNPANSNDLVYAMQLRLPSNRVRVKFQWGLTTDYGNETTPSEPIFAVTPREVRVVLATLTDLQPTTTYHYRAVAYTDEITVYGEDQAFTTTSSSGVLGVL